MMLLQEGSTVSWDPYPCFDCSCWGCVGDPFELIAWALPYCFAIYLCWLPLQLLAKWRATRYVLPTLMLPAAVLAILAPDTIPIALNAPAVIGAQLASLAIEEATPSALAVVAAILAWVSWYVVVLCAEAADAAPVHLNLTSR